MLEQRVISTELMDDPTLDAGTYQAVLHDLARVNTITLARRSTLDFLERAIGNRPSFSLLDVGFGEGDMLRAIAAWAVRRGKTASLVGIDLNPKSEHVAREATDPDLPIEYLTGDYADLSGHRYDCVVSNLVAHHMTRDQLLDFLHFMDAEAQCGWFINDLHRHGFAYTVYPLLARLARWHPIVRHDGQLSIARSFRPGEWLDILRAAGVTNANVYRVFPFRLCVGKTR